MKLTNKDGLPDAFVRAVAADPYTKGDSDFSATGLATPARAAVLIEQAGENLEVDVSTRVASTIGQGAHSILERAARPGIDIIETRYFAKFEVDGKPYIISTRIDLFESDSGTLHDWKTTKAYAFHKKSGAGKKPEWLQQMNVAAEIMRRQPVPIEVKALKIIGLLKDWNRREVTSPGYPPTEVMTVELPLWDREKAVRYIEERIRAHVAARVELPQCSSKETWGGNRCAGGWCDAASVCSQFQSMKKTGLIKDVKEVAEVVRIHEEFNPARESKRLVAEALRRGAKNRVMAQIEPAGATQIKGVRGYVKKDGTSIGAYKRSTPKKTGWDQVRELRAELKEKRKVEGT